METRTNLIINHLPHSLKDTDFNKLFSEIGTIKSYRVMKDLKTGASFGYGFVDYETPDDAAKAILQLNNFALQNKRLKVAYASPPGSASADKENNLYVQNLPLCFTNEKLEELFGVYGTIENKLVFKDKLSGMPKGIAFVKFENAADAASAMQALNGQVPIGGTEPLNIKVAKDKDGNINKSDPAYQAGYAAGLAKGRARGQFNNRGGFGRGGFNEMVSQADMYGGHEEFLTADFNPQAGKIGIDRSNNRYNPIGSGGGYGASGMSSYGAAEGLSFGKEATPYRTQFEGYSNGRGSGGFGASARGFSASGRGSFGAARGVYGNRY